MNEFKEESLPKELEEKYEKYQNYFDFWRIRKYENKVEFYVVGKYAFEVGEKLDDNDIIKYVNLYEFIYKTGYDNGVRDNRQKIKDALNI